MARRNQVSARLFSPLRRAICPTRNAAAACVGEAKAAAVARVTAVPISPRCSAQSAAARQAPMTSASCAVMGSATTAAAPRSPRSSAGSAPAASSSRIRAACAPAANSPSRSSGRVPAHSTTSRYVSHNSSPSGPCTSSSTGAPSRLSPPCVSAGGTCQRQRRRGLRGRLGGDASMDLWLPEGGEWGATRYPRHHPPCRKPPRFRPASPARAVLCCDVFLIMGGHARLSNSFVCPQDRWAIAFPFPAVSDASPIDRNAS